MLGGERIPHTHGVLAHSDGDVLLHALCDALLGAAGLGDIGMHFPDTRPALARRRQPRVRAPRRALLLQDRGYRVVNVDATVLAEAPRLGTHREAMRANIAATWRSTSGGSTSRRRPAKVSASSAAAKVWRARRSC